MIYIIAYVWLVTVVSTVSVNALRDIKQDD